MNKDLPVLSTQDDPISALNLMDQYRVGHLPVVENGKFAGIISETALLGLESILQEHTDQDLKMLQVSVRPNEHILDVLKVASQFHISVIPVTDGENNYFGSITLEDLVEKLSEMQGAHQRGGRPCARQPRRPGEVQGGGPRRVLEHARGVRRARPGRGAQDAQADRAGRREGRLIWM
jgi:predicted transcriptional regulator